MAVIVGVVVEKDNKFLLVQEAQEKCRGKWNLPAGHLDPGESLIEAAKREAWEESGFKVEPLEICQIGNRVMQDENWVSVIFTAKILEGRIRINPDEILDAKWFTYEEILNMHAELRNETMIVGAINNSRSNLTAPLNLIAMYDPL